MTMELEREVARLRRALQRIADLPATNHPKRPPLKRTPRRIAVAALRYKASAKRNRANV